MRTSFMLLLLACICIGCGNTPKMTQIQETDRPKGGYDTMIERDAGDCLLAAFGNDHDNCRTAALIYMAHRNLSGGIENLLKAGAKINKAEKYDGETPLIAAASMLSYECVELLLERGADVNATDKEGRTALDHAMKFEPPKISGVFYTNQPKVVELLKKYGAK